MASGWRNVTVPMVAPLSETVTCMAVMPVSDASGVTSTMASRDMVRRGMFLASLPDGSTVWFCANCTMPGSVPPRSLRTVRVLPFLSLS